MVYGAVSTSLCISPFCCSLNVSQILVVDTGVSHLKQLGMTGAAHVIFATNVLVASSALTLAFSRLEQALEPTISAGNLTAVEEVLLLSPEALNVQTVLANMQVNWQSSVANVITYTNGNLSQLDYYLTGEAYYSLSQLLTNYKFAPEVSPVTISVENMLKTRLCYRKNPITSSTRPLTHRIPKRASTSPTSISLVS